MKEPSMEGLSAKFISIGLIFKADDGSEAAEVELHSSRYP